MCRVAVSSGLALLLVLLAAVSAQAETRYRYWSYWKAEQGSWSYATVGPASVPADGGVEGWRFAASAEGQAPPPRRTPSFAALCRDVATKAGTKRVGVVVDYGLPRDSEGGRRPPDIRGYCAQVPPDANGYAVLDAVASFRANSSGLVCGIDGYPAAGCGDAVGAPATSAAPSSAATSGESGQDGGAGSLAALGGVAAAVVLGAAALLRSRRRPR